MKYITLILFILPILFSCSKDKENTPQPIAPSNSPPQNVSLVTTVGSYWVYNWYKIDSTNTETLLTFSDSIYVHGDTLINGKVFTIYKGGFYGGSNQTYLFTDSSGYIINNGLKIFTYNDFGTIYNLYCENAMSFCKYETSYNSTTKKSVPAGNFDVINTQKTYYMTDSSWFSTCDSVWISNNYYDKNSGFEVSSQFGFIGPLKTHCLYYERRLVNYHIAP